LLTQNHYPSPWPFPDLVWTRRHRLLEQHQSSLEELKRVIVRTLLLCLLLATNSLIGKEQAAEKQAAQDTPLAIALRAIGKEKANKALDEYARIEGEDDRFKMIEAFIKELRPTDLLQDDKERFAEILDEYLERYPKTEILLTNVWKRVLTNAFPPLAKRFAPPVRIAPADQKSAAAGIAIETAAPTTIKLISQQDRRQVLLPRVVALNPLVSGLLATTLEHEQNAPEIPIASIRRSVLATIAPLLTQVHDLLNTQPQDQTPAQKNASMIRAITPRLDAIENIDQRLPDLIYATNYMDATYLCNALLWRYTTRLQANPHKLNKESILKELQVEALLPIIARYYFLQFDEDIDAQLSLPRQKIDFETLVVYEKIPPDLLKSFPNLVKDPNATLTHSNNTHYTALSTAARDGNINTVRALLKLKTEKPLDLNGPTKDPTLINAINSGPITLELLNAGANPNITDGSAMQNNWFWHIMQGHQSINFIEEGLKHGLNPNKAINLSGVMPLTHAIKFYRCDIAQRLIAAGAWISSDLINTTAAMANCRTTLPIKCREVQKFHQMLLDLNKAYCVMNLPFSASVADIKSKFMERALVLHPCTEPPENKRAEYEARYKAVYDAYQILKKYLGFPSAH
jgi:hypothetical protein